MHLLVPVFGYNEAFDDEFVVNKLDWDALYKAVSTYLDADYFEYTESIGDVNEAIYKLESNVIVFENSRLVAYCGEGRCFDEWIKVRWLGNIDVHV